MMKQVKLFGLNKVVEYDESKVQPYHEYQAVITESGELIAFDEDANDWVQLFPYKPSDWVPVLEEEPVPPMHPFYQNAFLNTVQEARRAYVFAEMRYNEAKEDVQEIHVKRDLIDEMNRRFEAWIALTVSLPTAFNLEVEVHRIHSMTAENFDFTDYYEDIEYNKSLED